VKDCWKSVKIWLIYTDKSLVARFFVAHGCTEDRLLNIKDVHSGIDYQIISLIFL